MSILMFIYEINEETTATLLYSQQAGSQEIFMTVTNSYNSF